MLAAPSSLWLGYSVGCFPGYKTYSSLWEIVLHVKWHNIVVPEHYGKSYQWEKNYCEVIQTNVLSKGYFASCQYLVSCDAHTDVAHLKVKSLSQPIVSYHTYHSSKLQEKCIHWIRLWKEETAQKKFHLYSHCYNNQHFFSSRIAKPHVKCCTMLFKLCYTLLTSSLCFDRLMLKPDNSSIKPTTLPQYLSA